MKRILYILIAAVVLVVCSYSLSGSNDETSLDINQAIGLGQCERIAEYLAPDVLLVMQGKETTCSKGQVEQVLCEFFKQNKPAQFLCPAGRGLVSGTFVSRAGRSYKLEYTLQTIDNKDVITGFYVY